MKRPKVLAPDTQYYVCDWRSGNIIVTCVKASTARRICREQGYESNAFLHGSPKAFVQVDYIITDYQGRYDPKSYATYRGFFYQPRARKTDQ